VQGQALQGIRIIDLTHYIAGPYCTKLFSNLGAEVIKIERPGTGDPSRNIGPFPKNEPHPENSGVFLYLNTGKKSITLNLKSQAGKTILKQLIKESDAVIENFSPRVMPSLGFDYATLSAIKPSLVMTSISNFGQTGSYRDWKASDLVAYAMGGVSYSGYSDSNGAPSKPFGSPAQHIAGLYGAAGTQIALHYRDKSGVGTHVDISIMDCVASIEEHALVMATYQDVVKTRSQYRSIIAKLWPCKDGYVQIPFASFTHWVSLCQLAGLPQEWRTEAFFQELRANEELNGVVAANLEGWLMSHTRAQITEAVSKLSRPFIVASVQSIAEAVEDPQYKARGFFVKVNHPYAGEVTYPGAPFKMSETPCNIRRAPLLGEHNEEIYCQRLGYSKEDLLRLRERGDI